VRLALADVTAGDAMDAPALSLTPVETVAAVLPASLATAPGSPIAVVDGGSLIAVTDAAALARVMSTAGPQATVASAVRPLPVGGLIDARSSLEAAARALQVSGEHGLLVIRDGRVVGVLSSDAVSRVAGAVARGV
jgi:predicted transcriptional regulator